MNVHILQHVPFEDIGSMISWLHTQHAQIQYTRFYESALLPEIETIDMVIIMGGPMSVNDERRLPWLKPEKQFIREVVKQGIPTLGVCLGAQLIASALGSSVYPNREKEIGWFDIQNIENSRSGFQFPEQITVFHWHGETFDLPAGAIHLARSAACEHQAFQIGRHVIGLQFHLESTPASVDAMLYNCRQELVSGKYIQTEAAIRALPEHIYANNNRLMEQVLSYLMNFSSY